MRGICKAKKQVLQTQKTTQILALPFTAIQAGAPTSPAFARGRHTSQLCGTINQGHATNTHKLRQVLSASTEPQGKERDINMNNGYLEFPCR